MSKGVTIVFPNQLFKVHPAVEKGREIYLLEEWLYFKQYNFHKQKLVLHRASMKFYEDWLQKQSHTVTYIENLPSLQRNKLLMFILWMLLTIG
jgi:deoxyribodipyrimidine photolyase-related protein